MRRGNIVLSIAGGLALHSAAGGAQQSPSAPPATSETSETSETSFARTVQLQREVAALAFDPSRFFGAQPGRLDMVTIAYTGDDYAWPVYSIAVREGCFPSEAAGARCRARRTARMVRAAAPPDLRRPRQRGINLIMEIRRRGDRSVADALDRAGLEWLEADLGACPAATRVVEDAGSIQWVPRQLYAPRPGDYPDLILHADKIEVTFATFARRSTYHGYVAPASPAAWAVRLAEALETCWRPSTAVAPWRR